MFGELTALRGAIGRVLGSFALLGVFVLATSCALLFHLNLPRGRRVVAATLERALNETLTGRFRIGRVDRVTLAGVRASNLEVRDPQDRLVLTVAELRVAANVPTLLANWLGKGPELSIPIEHVLASRAEMHWYDDGSGAPSVRQAFGVRSSSSPVPEAPRSVRVVIRAIELSRGIARGTPTGLPTLEAEVRQVRGSLDASEAGAELRIGRFGVNLRGFPGTEVRGVGSVQLSPSGLVQAAYDGYLGDVALAANAHIDGEQLAIALDLPRATPEAMRALVPDWPLLRDVTVHLEAAGKLPDLRAQGSATFGDSRLLLEGTLRSKPQLGAELGLRGERFDVAAFSEQVPATALDFTAQLGLKLLANGLSASLTGRTQPTTWQGEPVPASEISANYEAGKLQGRALLQEPSAPVQLEFSVLPGGIVDLQAETRGVQLEEQRRLAPYAPGSGLLGLKLRAHVEQGRVTASFDAWLRSFSREGLSVGSLTASGAAKGSLDRLAALQLNARVKAKELRYGSFAFADGNVTLVGPLLAPRVELTLSDTGGTELKASARVTRVPGGVQLDRAELKASRGHASLQGSVHAFEFTGDRLHIEGFALTGLDGTLTGSADVRPTLLALTAIGKNLDVGGVARLLGLPTHYAHGKLDLAADVVIARDIERGSVGFALQQGSVGPLSDVAGSFEAHLQGGRLRAELSGNVGSILNAAGQLELDLPGSIRKAESFRDATGNAKLTLSQVDLSLLGRAVAPGQVAALSGKLSAELSATRERPDTLPTVRVLSSTNSLGIGPGVLFATAPAVQGIDAQLGARLVGESGESELSLKLLDAKGDLASATLTTELDYQAALKDPSALWQQLLHAPVLGKLLIDDRSLADLPSALAPVDLSGRARAEVSLSGTLSAPVVNGRLRLTALEWVAERDPRLLDVCLNFGWELATRSLGSSGELFLNNRKAGACAGRRIAQYSLNGALEVPSDGSTPKFRGGGVASLEALPLETVPGLGDSGLAGQASGRISLTQEGATPVLSANLSFVNTEIQGAPVGDGKLELRSNERLLGVNLALARGDGSLDATLLLGLDTSGALPKLSERDPASLRLDARRADAALLLPFARDVLSEISGKIDANVTLSIPLGKQAAGAAPLPAQVRGDFALHEGSLQLARLNAKLRKVELSARAEADGDETLVLVQKLDAQGSEERQTVHVQGGKLWLRGFEISRAEARIDATELPLVLEGVTQAIATTRQSVALAVRRTPKEMQATLTIPYLLIALPQAGGRNLISLDENRSIQVRQPLGEPVRLGGDGLPWRLRIELGPEVKLTRADLDLPLSGSLEVVLADATEVSGSVDLEPGGRVEVSGKTFVIDHGEVHFDTGDAANPRLNVSAEWRAPDGSLVTADVTGTLDRPSLGLSSPSHSREETLALLLGGAPSEGTDAQVTGAAVGAENILGPLLANTPLRNVEIRTGSQTTADQRSYSTYTAAVPISDSVWFEGSYKTLNSNDPSEQTDAWSGTVDWRFRRNWSLRTEVGKIGTGIDLSWNYRY